MLDDAQAVIRCRARPGARPSVLVASPWPLDNSFETLQSSYALSKLAGDAGPRSNAAQATPARRVLSSSGKAELRRVLRYTKPDYQLSWFHEELAGELDQFLDDVLQKRSQRLIINVPPQEGKSEQVSRRFPAYALARDPNLRVVACSYSATLALQFSRDAQLIMDEPNYARLFPESIIPGIATKHNAAVFQADHYELVKHRGSYRCAGIRSTRSASRFRASAK